jgi:hypothetical protein
VSQRWRANCEGLQWTPDVHCNPCCTLLGTKLLKLAQQLSAEMGCGLGGLDVGSLLAFGASSDVKRYALTFLERLEATGVDCGVMREEILSTVFRGDEAKTFCVVEPLNCSVCHDASYFHKAIFRHYL